MIELPKSIFVVEVISSRYSSGLRPESWDSRVAGLDVVLANDGNRYSLQSDGQQSPPQIGWEIVLREGDNRSGYYWTLYGIGSSPADPT